MNTLASPQVVVYLMCLFLGVIAHMSNQISSSSVPQQRSFVSARAGDSLTLHCFYEGDEPGRFYWYMQTLEEEPKIISSVLKSKKKFIQFHDEFSNNPRFTLNTEKGKNHLMISDLRISDSAAYFCISSFLYTSVLLESVTVNVRDSSLKIQVLVQQSASETIQTGGSVTLNCTVHTGTCDGEHSVYWFKESQPLLIYTHGGRNEQCERRLTQTNTCIFNFPMNNLNVSHAGTYYCAFASCGHILFGNGTSLNFEDRTNLDIKDEQDSPVLVYFLSTALTITSIISILSSFLLYKMNRSKSSQSAESKATDSENVEAPQDENNLHYAALRKSRMERKSRQRSTTEVNVCTPV